MAIIIQNKTFIVLSIVFVQIWFPWTNLFYYAQIQTIPIQQHHHRTSSNNTYDELLNLRPSASSQTQQRAVLDLINRIVPPGQRDRFRITIDPRFVDSDRGQDRFRIEPNKRKNLIHITGTTGVVAANGFYYYLKYVANSSISWSGDNIHSGTFPLPSRTIEMTIREKFRYYQNACTVSYSMVWWKWPRWQREIDWMALNGINFPLAPVGQELIYRRTLERFNLTRKEIDQYFTGPAYLAWNRMGNIRRWGGPLSENWHQHQTVLQIKILEGMRNFGMYPIVPGFSGHVPEAFVERYPEAQIKRLADWNHFGENYSQTHFLEPIDPYFFNISTAFIDEYRKLFGSDHFYNIDLFVEETPPSNEIDYLAKMSKSVYDSIHLADPKAIWVLQGYPFNALYDKFWGRDQVRALVTAVPKNRMVILDSIAEVIPVYPRTDGYFGQPFIWCMLQNYGGVHGMFGSLNRINDAVYEARRRYPQMLGIGLTPEGINQNDVVFDYMMETPWRDDPPNLQKWFRQYSSRRYPINDHRIESAWELLSRSVYHDPIGIKNHGRYVFTSRPRPNSHSMLWYNPHNLTAALRLFSNVANDHPSLVNRSVTFVHDLVDISRQTVQLIFDHYYKIIDESFEQQKNLDLIPDAIQKSLQALDLIEKLLQSCQNCLLHNWISDARSLGNDQKEQDYHEWQARTQISIWGPKGNIANYAAKQWSGMFQYLYRPRWQFYFDELTNCIRKNHSFNLKKFKKKLFNLIELPFTQARGQNLITTVNTSNLMTNVDQVLEQARITIDKQTNFQFYFNDKERWLDNE